MTDARRKAAPLPGCARDDDSDAMGLAARIADGQLSATEAVQAAIARSDKADPAINAVCNPTPDLALAAAREIDEQISKARSEAGGMLALRRLRPFLGVPTLLKDLSTPAIGLPSTMGSRLFGKVKWEVDGALVERYRAAGFVFIGRSTSPELGISPSTEAVAYGGPTRNPWSLEHSAGGSSGGAAAAVMADMVPIAHASDGAGSIRIPATNCGLFGLKPSRGVMPAGPLIGETWGGLATEHFVTRSVRDSALAFDLAAGADRGAPYASPLQPPSCLLLAEEARRSPVEPLRIAACFTTFDGEAVHPEVEAAVRNAAKLLASFGHRVEEARPGVSTMDALRPMLDLIAAGTAMAVGAREAVLGRPANENELEPVTRSAVAYGRSLNGPQVLQAVAAIHRVGRAVGEFMAEADSPRPGFDLMLSPVLATPPIELGRIAMSHPDFLEYRIGPEGIVRYSPFTPLANATGQPSASVPFARSSAGLPIGIQITARFGEDWRIFQVAAQIEAAQPWPAHAPLTT